MSEKYVLVTHNIKIVERVPLSDYLHSSLENGTVLDTLEKIKEFEEDVNLFECIENADDEDLEHEVTVEWMERGRD